MLKLAFLAVTHGAVLALGFVLGVFYLPILIAPAPPSASVLEAISADAPYQVEISNDLRGSDFLHWGDGTISVSPTQIAHQGSLAPGPDYRLYLVSEFAEHEDEFLPLKQDAIVIGRVSSFDGFVLDVPAGVDVSNYTTALIWCETFGEFITAVQYR